MSFARFLPWAALAFAPALVVPTQARAQTEAESESAGRSRGGYAWGEPAPDDEPATARPALPEDRHYGTVFASIGAGGTVRILAHADVCNPDVPGREGCRFSPGYLQLQGGYLLDTPGAVQHGVGLGVAANLSPDGTTGEGLDPFGQWVLAPRYALRYWASDWFQVMAQVGIPLSFASITGTSTREPFAFNWGLELQVGAVFKFLHGLGVYAAANGAAWFAGADSVWPTISVEGGLVFDYEVLP